MTHLFITGTDTDVGKTYFTCALLRTWRALGKQAAALKPISAGDRQDAELLRSAGDSTLSVGEINPVYLREPAAPLVAAPEEKRTLDFPTLNQTIRETCARFTHVAIEGVGGWRVPLAPGYEVRDWARDLALPVVVVARAGLGTLNHTLLTVENIRATGLVCAGVVLNPGPGSPDIDLAGRTNGRVLHEILGLPVFELARLVHAPGEIPVWLGGE